MFCRLAFASKFVCVCVCAFKMPFFKYFDDKYCLELRDTSASALECSVTGSGVSYTARTRSNTDPR